MKLHEIKSPLSLPETDPDDETPPSENIQQISRKIPHTHLKQIYYLFCSQYHRSWDFTTKFSNLSFYWKLNELQAFIYLIQFHLKVK